MIDVPGVPLDEIAPLHKADEIFAFGKYKGKSYGEVYNIDSSYLRWLASSDRFFRIDFDELKRLYPDVKEPEETSILERKITFGQYRGKTFGEIKNDTNYLQWMVSVGRLPIEDYRTLTQE